mmetsp:Transcript_30399/g.56262  ORF Transcript_30399/g.56262 Transcript_30399/m.56262 type:complete len:282 (-) Transcript_30399:847-1692(-)
MVLRHRWHRTADRGGKLVDISFYILEAEVDALLASHCICLARTSQCHLSAIRVVHHLADLHPCQAASATQTNITDKLLPNDLVYVFTCLRFEASLLPHAHYLIETCRGATIHLTYGNHIHTLVLCMSRTFHAGSKIVCNAQQDILGVNVSGNTVTSAQAVLNRQNSTTALDELSSVLSSIGNPRCLGGNDNKITRFNVRDIQSGFQFNRLITSRTFYTQTLFPNRLNVLLPDIYSPHVVTCSSKECCVYRSHGPAAEHRDGFASLSCISSQPSSTKSSCFI